MKHFRQFLQPVRSLAIGATEDRRPKMEDRSGQRATPSPISHLPSSAPNLYVPKWKTLPTSFERELRTGGLLHQKLERERAATKERMASAALPHRDYQRKPGSEMELQAVVDARTWMRWYLTDPYFWHDKNNIKRFVKDNPIAAPWKT